MTSKFDRVVWNQPRWIHYGSAVLLAFAGFWTRSLSTEFLGDKAPYLFVLLAVPAAAYIGGFWPGMVCTVLSMLMARWFFIAPQYSFVVDNPQAGLQFVLTLMVCVTINAFAARLRFSALRNGRLLDQLASDRKQMSDVLQGLTDLFFVVEKDWRILQTNPAFDESLHAEPGALVGRNLWDVFKVNKESTVYKTLRRVMEKREPELVEFAGDSPEKWFEVRAFPTEFGVSVFIQDISERKQFEGMRDRMLTDERVARSAAEEAGRLKEDFLANLSHELRTPMTSLLGWASMLNRGKVDPERLAEGLNSIEQSARTQSKMVDELLDLSRINVGKLRVEMEILSLNELVDEAITVHRPAAVAKGIHVVVHDAPEEILVRGDSGRLHQVFGNLISNAIKFTPRGGTVEITASQDGKDVCFRVVDNGEGISAEFLPHIFDRFRQANSSYARKHGGLGLGLSIAKHLVELQGGTITARSEGAGKGSTFEVCLPVVPLNDQRFRVGPGASDHFSLEGCRVLIVEDDAATAVMLQRLVEEQSGTVCAAPTAQEAFRIITEFQPTVIVSDIGLPEIDGYRFMRMLRERDDEYAKTPSVALTAFAREADRAAAKTAGFDAFLTKPVNPVALIKAIFELANPA